MSKKYMEIQITQAGISLFNACVSIDMSPEEAEHLASQLVLAATACRVFRREHVSTAAKEKQ